MPTKAELLDEYCNIHDDLNKLRDKIELLKQEARIKFSFCRTDREKKKILDHYKKQLNCIKNDTKLKETYKSLKYKQDEIKKILIDDNKIYYITSYKFNNYKNIFNEKNKDKYLAKYIGSLLNKYKKFSTDNSASSANYKFNKIYHKKINK